MNITIVKVGGAIVEDEAQLRQLIDNFAKIKGPKILVHGGGRRATKIAAQLGIESHMVGGRRITDADMLDVVTMVYGGLVNKHLVAMLQAKGINAIGLTGADMDIIRSHKRPLKRMEIDGKEEMVDFGFVGDVDRADGKALMQLLKQGAIPVIAPLTHDGQGNILNTNADTMAAETACGMAAEGGNVTLIYSFEKRGVLANPDDDNSVIPVITHRSFEEYKADGTISGGMLPKIENALNAIDRGVAKVVITLATAIDGNSGTMII
ncbi:acetylglutamate kinase [Prevotella sp. PINT]|jgi:acetylglutamate kinase|uniref:acetylglutamate kinase n=1 Tax=Palleniella intestinalis TaxID=2736291 RepID=UPI001552BE2E|nr:acetylglutamate kinase [Palleniella intestinalis]NPD81735.1 acetylglutamate kinase [Palleniella intestinalis]